MNDYIDFISGVSFRLIKPYTGLSKKTISFARKLEKVGVSLEIINTRIPYGEGDMRKPDFFIVGAPRCGTTSMYYYLKQHPEIFLPEVKEPHYFNIDHKSHRFIRDKEKYLSLFASVKNEKRVGEASTWYLYSKRAATEIKEFCPTARIIIMLRNPVDMIYSLHSHNLYKDNEELVDLESALSVQEDRKDGKRIPSGAHFPECLFYTDVVKYTEQVQRYLNIFGFENVYVIIFDDFKNDTAGVYREIIRFLDVRPDFLPNFQIINTNKRARSQSLQSFLRNPPPIIRSLGRSLMPRLVRHGLIKGFMWSNALYDSRSPMDKELRRRLQAEFLPEVKKLSELLGRDLTHWCKT